MKITAPLFLFISLFYVNHIKAQDTLSGNYTSLKIPTGLHVIKDVVRVTGAFEIEPGAKIEMIDAGLIVCEGSVTIKGIDKNIEFFGKKNIEGIGIIIKSIDSNKVVINNTIFKSLQLPILFDFGYSLCFTFILSMSEANNFLQSLPSVDEDDDDDTRLENNKNEDISCSHNNSSSGNGGVPKKIRLHQEKQPIFPPYP